MSYALTMLWYERQRCLAAVLAIAFSTLLIALQCGLLLGMFSFASLAIDHTQADVWVGGPVVESIDVGSPIPERFLARVLADPRVERCEIHLQGFCSWFKRDGGSELCVVIGSRLGDKALGAVRELTPELRNRLTEPGSVVIDESDRPRLGVRGVGDQGEIEGRRVRVVGMVRGVPGLIGARVFCSIETARGFVELPPDQTIFLLARCRSPADAPAVVRRLRAAYPDLSAYTRAEFSRRSQMHWLTKTKAGIALGWAALLGLVVGAVVTSQTLYAAAAVSRREYALLRAMGVPRWRMGALIVAQSFWVGVVGTALALPAAFGLGGGADVLGLKVLLPAWLLAASVAVTLLTALASSLAALRMLRLLDPGILLH